MIKMSVIKKISLLILSVLLMVSSSQATETCTQKYLRCAFPLINNWGHPLNCSLAEPFMACVINVTEDCHPNDVPLLQRYQKFTEDVCSLDGTRKEEWKEAKECVSRNTNKFGSCSANIKDEGCKATREFLECFTSTMGDTCGGLIFNITESVTFPLLEFAKECEKAEEGISAVEKCLFDNSERLRSCKWEGEFNKIGDICTSAEGYTKCFFGNITDNCTSEATEILQHYIDDILFAMETCKSLKFINDIPISECHRKVLECNVELHNINEPICTDISKYVGCLADAAEKCERHAKSKPLYVRILEKYKHKFPYYCSESFRKSIEAKTECINNSSGDVTGPCYEKLQKDMDGVGKDDKAGKLKGYVNFLVCVSKGFEKGCGKEAESAVNELLKPLEQSMDDECIQLTGKKCNGANALVVGTWLLIAAIVFLLSRKDE